MSAGHLFAFEIGDGIVINQIIEASGLKVDQDVVELKQQTSDGKYVIKKLPGRPRPGKLTLTRERSNDNSFANLVEMVRAGKLGTSNGALIVYDSDGTVIKRYRFINALPESWQVDAAIPTEKLILTYEAIEYEQ